MEIHINSKKLIKPSVPTPSHLRNMKISFMDQMIPPTTVPFIFYYPASGNYHPIEQVERQTRLEKSLSENLTSFYPLAGRYIKDDLLINCNDEGIEYIEALVNEQLAHILFGELDANKLNHLVPDEELDELETSPLMSIQINTFNCGGLVIGLRMSHRIIDAFTLSMFMHGWAKTCKAGINDIIVPNFESGILFPARDFSVIQFPPSCKTTSEVVTKRLVFDSRTLSKLKVEATSRCGLKSEPSTTEVLIGLIWRAQIKAKRARYGRMIRTSVLLVLMNLRGKMFKKIPENCCGNFYTRIITKFHADERKMEGLTDFVDQVRDAIRSSTLEYAKPVRGEEELFSKVMKPCIEMAEESRKGEVDVHLFSSVVKSPFYEVDFGWGRPAWVSMAHRPYKAVFFLGRKGGDGVEAWVTMDKFDMDYFLNDPNIIMSMERGKKLGDGFPVLRPKI